MEGIAIVEQMGHKRIIGRVSETEVCGVKMLRVETLHDPPGVQIVHPQTIYALTPCTEMQARRAGEFLDSPLASLGALPAPTRERTPWVEPGQVEHDDRDDRDDDIPL